MPPQCLCNEEIRRAPTRICWWDFIMGIVYSISTEKSIGFLAALPKWVFAFKLIILLVAHQTRLGVLEN